MKTQIILIFSIVLLLQSCAISQNLSNNKACRKFEKQLIKFELCLENDETIFCNRKNRLIWYFEELTGIGGNTLNYDTGILIPNQELLDAYNQWYLENKENLYWNWKARLIELSKEKNPNRSHLNE